MGEVVLDASVLIAFLNAGDAQHQAASTLLRSLMESQATLLIPMSVYAEILVGPMRADKAETVDSFLAAANALLIEIDRSIARSAAALRATHASLRPPDTLCLATARARGVQLLTFDQRLQKIAKAQA